MHSGLEGSDRLINKTCKHGDDCDRLHLILKHNFIFLFFYSYDC